MPSAVYGPNTIEINGAAMLLTSTSGGVAVHLTAAVDESCEGREAVFDVYFDSDRNDPADMLWVIGYDRAALTAALWSHTTVCGREWAIMVGVDGGAIGRYGEVAYAPTCRRCLALVDRHFPKPTPDSRLALVGRLAADVVVDQRGYVEIHGVPGINRTNFARWSVP
jgi:hypothetical protein